MPLSYHIAQELQKYNIPDYRPRQEQYVYFRLSFPVSINAHVVGSKRPSRRFVRSNECGAIVDLRSVRRKAVVKIRHDLSEHMIHRKRGLGPRGISLWTKQADGCNCVHLAFLDFS